MTHRRISVFRMMRARPRLFLAACAGLVAGLFPLAVVAGHWVTRLLVGWNVGTCLYVFLAAVMMIRSADHHIRQRADLQDDGQVLILLLAALATAASLMAIAGQLAIVKDLHSTQRLTHICLAGLTVLSSWAFIQVMFSLHYAHDYYAAIHLGNPPPLVFPNPEPPTYGDFFHFSAVIGTSGQTADITFFSKKMRRIGTVHCIMAYLFNTTVLALLINIGASLL